MPNSLARKDELNGGLTLACANSKRPSIPRSEFGRKPTDYEPRTGRAAHRAGCALPVKVLDLAEFDLHLDLVPVNGLREQLDIDALLMGDLKSVLVDKRAFMSPRLEYRLRFSVAHEIGHLILHRDIYAGLQHATAVQWFDYISAIPE